MARTTPLAQPAVNPRERLIAWIRRHEKVATRDIKLIRRRIYILPTRYGYLYALVLIVMLLGATNYSNSMAFALTFLLASLGANAMWQTHRNLLDLTVTKGAAAPVFAGRSARFRLEIENPSRRPRYGLALQWQNAEVSLADVPAQGSAQVELLVPAPRRGVLSPKRFRLYTRYPLGLFQAWSWLEFEMTTLVYPKPIDTTEEMPTAASDRGQAGTTSKGSEDYSGLREYHAGDSPKRIAWKAAARSEVLMTKQFAGEARQEVWLDWNALHGLDTELRLSILCRWVLDAQQAGLRYGLELPGSVIAADSGEVHQQRCLRALALFDVHQ